VRRRLRRCARRSTSSTRRSARTNSPAPIAAHPSPNQHLQHTRLCRTAEARRYSLSIRNKQIRKLSKSFVCSVISSFHFR
jgi:hypothetical protein